MASTPSSQTCGLFHFPPKISHRVPKGSKRQPSDRKHVHSSPGILAGGWFISNASESEIQQCGIMIHHYTSWYIMIRHYTLWYIMILYIMSSYGFGTLPWVYPSKNGSADVVSCRAHSLKGCWAIHQLASHWATGIMHKPRKMRLPTCNMWLPSRLKFEGFLMFRDVYQHGLIWVKQSKVSSHIENNSSINRFSMYNHIY